MSWYSLIQRRASNLVIPICCIGYPSSSNMAPPPIASVVRPLYAVLTKKKLRRRKICTGKELG
jgi:hypothetical protein